MSLPRSLLPLQRRLPRRHDRPPGATSEAAGTPRAGDATLTALLPRGADDRLVLIERCAWSVVWVGVLTSGAGLWAQWWSWPLVDVLAPVLVGVALLGLVICWCGRDARSRLHQGLGLVAALVAAGAPEAVQLHTRRFYLTDSAALDHVAARVLVHGHDPYTASLSSAARLLHDPSSFWTYTVTGGHVVNVSYPAGSFLAYAPAIALGFHHEIVDWIDLFAWLAAVLLLFLALPRFLRWLAPLLALTGIFTGMFAGGGTEAVLVPLAIVAVWRWDRYGRGREAGIARWVGPVALGLACSVKQTAWVLLPFLVVGVFAEARRSGRPPVRTSGRYVATGLAAFGAVNAPFLVASPLAWWRGVTTPLLDPLVADGQGLVSLALHGITGGVDLTLLAYASGLAYLAVLVAVVAWYPRLKRVWPFLVPIVAFVSPRSFTGYLIDLVPLALVAAVTVEKGAMRSGGDLRRWRFNVVGLGAGVLALAAGAAAALAFAIPAPLALSMDHASIGHNRLLLREVTVTVTNRTATPVAPHFMVDVGAPHPTGFWTTAHHRRVVVGPHRAVTVRLYPPSPTSFVPSASNWVVDAYTARPRWLSTSREEWHDYVPPTSPGTRL
ncbi:MAG: hypothetical protein ACRDYZ_01575 [Acidimicrobiales bacterium]